MGFNIPPLWNWGPRYFSCALVFFFGDRKHTEVLYSWSFCQELGNGKFCCAMWGFPHSSQNFLENGFCISSTRLHIIHRFIFIFTGNVYDRMWTGLFTFNFYSTFWKAPKCSHRPPFPQWRAKECPFGLHLSAMHRDPFFFGNCTGNISRLCFPIQWATPKKFTMK